MNILITGASGLVGSALCDRLVSEGHGVVRLVRRKPGPGSREIFWDPKGGSIDRASLNGAFDAVVHLAGDSIASGRWTESKKRSIRESRTEGTLLLAGALADLPNPPAAMISASAVGYYGDRGAATLTEASPHGSGFLADVCLEWEQAASKVVRGGSRLVLLRIGMVLSGTGGALGRMLLPFRLGLGGRLGSGRQFMSWICIDDLVAIILFALGTPDLQGPVNAVAPVPVTNREFTAALGKVLHRPTWFPVPEFVIRLAFGEMGQQLLLASTKVEPARLSETGFRFRYPEIEQALGHILTGV